MHKGFLFIILALVLAGITSVFGFYFYTNPQALENISLGQIFQAFPKTEQSSLISSTPVTSEPVSLSLNLSSPDNNLLIFESDLLVSGKTSAQSTIIFSLDEKDWAIEADNTGNFSQTLKLQDGVNTLKVTVFDKEGNNKNESRTIYYSKEKL